MFYFLNGQVKKNHSCQALASTCIIVCSSPLFFPYSNCFFRLVLSLLLLLCCWVSVSGWNWAVRGRWTTCRATYPLRADHAMCVHTETNGITHATVLQKRDPSSSLLEKEERVGLKYIKKQKSPSQIWSNIFHWLKPKWFWKVAYANPWEKISLTAANYR